MRGRGAGGGGGERGVRGEEDRVSDLKQIGQSSGARQRCSRGFAWLRVHRLLLPLETVRRNHRNLKNRTFPQLRKCTQPKHQSIQVCK